MDSQPLLKAPKVGVGAFGNVKQEIELIEEQNFPVQGEFHCETDQLTEIKRRIVIGIRTYGSHNLSQVSSFVGQISKQQIEKLLKEDGELQDILKNDKTVCWTKSELIARLCLEAETAQAPKDRINAISKLMEFRGISAPEGGSRNFARLVTRFKK